MGAENKLWLNGELVPAMDAYISPLDRGFALGDGIFETMRVSGGQILRLERHLARLRDGAKVLGVPILLSDAELVDACKQTLNANNLRDAFLRLTLSRGVPRVRGLLPDSENAEPTLVIQCGSFSGYPAELHQRGLRVITGSIHRNEHSPLSNIKSLNYLDNILARRQAVAQGADDALMLNTAGALVCASAANLFFVQAGRLVTAPLSAGALPGTMRAHVTEVLALALGLSVVEQALFPNELGNIEEAFLTNALMGVMPVVTIDKNPIGTAEPGRITRALESTLGGKLL